MQSGADSEQVADVVVRGDAVQAVWIDPNTGDDRPTPSAALGIWTPLRAVVEAGDALCVRGHVVRNAAGTMVDGMVCDAGSDGGSGTNRYDETALQANGP